MLFKLKILVQSLLLFCGLLSTGLLQAQQGNNPFEIPERQTTTSSPANEEENPFDLPQQAPAEATPSTPTNNNPFELNHSSGSSTPAAEEPANETNNPFDLNTNSGSSAPAVEEPTNSTENPFDLNNSSSPATPAVVEEIQSTQGNPFEVERPGETRLRPVQTAPSPVLQPQKKRSSTTNRNFLFWTSTLLLLLMAVLLTLYKPLINQIYRSFLNDNMLKLKHREQGSFLNLPFSLFYLSFFLNAGFFSYLILKRFALGGHQHLSLLLWSILGVMSVFLIKHFVLRVMGYIFPIDKELRQYSFTIVIFNIILGILLLPFNLLIAFGPGQLPKYLIFTLIGLIVLLYGFRIIRSLLIASRYISLHKFHFFMYLCTIEIAPTLVLVKLLLLLKGGANWDCIIKMICWWPQRVM